MLSAAASLLAQRLAGEREGGANARCADGQNQAIVPMTEPVEGFVRNDGLSMSPLEVALDNPVTGKARAHRVSGGSRSTGRQ